MAHFRTIIVHSCTNHPLDKVEHTRIPRKLISGKQSRCIIIDDPDKEFGYPPGTIFTSAEQTYMRQPQNHSFTPGTIVQIKNKIYRIIQEPSCKQKLVQLDAEPA